MSKLLEQINNERKEMTLGEVVTFHRGYDLPLTEIKSGPYPVVFSNGRRENHSEFKVKGPGVFTGRSGSLGGMFYVEENYWPHNTTLYVSDFHNNDPKYCYYFLSSFDFAKFNAGTGVPTLNRNHIHGIPVKIPDLPTQKKIASILSAYDDKIENNNKIIKNLEETAQAIFNEWFVNFKFSGHEKVKMIDSEIGEIPEGWEVKNLNTISDIIFGFNFKSSLFNEDGIGIPVVRIRDVLSGTTETFSPEKPTEEYKIKPGDLLVGMDGIFHCSFWYNDNAYLNQRVARIRSDLPGYFIYESIRDQLDFLQKTIIGATVGHLSNGNIREFKILVPNNHSFLEVFANITNKVLSFKKENVSLKSQRDLLLAKLI